MKQTVQLEMVQERMRPGEISAEGFLGTDSRNLVDIITEDGAALKRLGLTQEALAARMKELRDEGARGLGEFISVPPHFEVRVDSVRGRMPCPFGDGGFEQKGFTVVRNLRLGREIVYTDLGIHMIETHCFFEGRGAAYRIEPADLAEALELRPE